MKDSYRGLGRRKKPRVLAFECPKCGGWTNGDVTNSRAMPTESGIQRRRECECGYRFTTRERIVDTTAYNR